MAATLVLDTHALLWFLQGDDRLGAAAKSAISDPENLLLLPAIVLAEAMWIVERGRTNIPTPQHLLAAIDADARFRVVALDAAVLRMTALLPAITEMHDRQIVATVLTVNAADNPATLITADAQITQSSLVPVIW